jgi:hypothetical protein
MNEKGMTRRRFLASLTAGAAATSVLALSPGEKRLPAAGISTVHALANAKEATYTTRTSASPEAQGEAPIFNVMPAVSVHNVYAGITLPQHPYMADNNWNSGHQDSYCSESVGLHGPTSSRLRLVMAQAFGLMGIMACNRANQMIGMSFFLDPNTGQAEYRLVVFDQDLVIRAWCTTGVYVPGMFGGGYFYLNHEDNSVTNGDNVISCYPTANVQPGDPLNPLWTSDDIVELVTGSAQGNWLYSVLPLWDDPTLYWCLLSGVYDSTACMLYSDAYMAVAQIVPDPGQPNGCTTTLMDTMRLPRQWNNNTFAVDEQGAYFVTNGVDAQGISNAGALYAVTFDPPSKKIQSRWVYDYKNSGIPRVGKANMGSGTTPTLMDLEDDTRLVAIMDHALPQENVVVVDRENGELVAEVPLFPKMRGGNEASLIGVRDRIAAENNFGHTVALGQSQLVPNEGGMALIQLGHPGEGKLTEIVWEDNRTCCFGMNMLCRESGIIFAQTADWYDSESATEGGMFYISAIDAWDGRVIWRIPLGRGWQYTKDFGGQYFDRDGNLYVGTRGYLISIQNAEDSGSGVYLPLLRR